MTDTKLEVLVFSMCRTMMIKKMLLMEQRGTCEQRPASISRREERYATISSPLSARALLPLLGEASE
jgi:hypothetical protein